MITDSGLRFNIGSPPIHPPPSEKRLHICFLINEIYLYRVTHDAPIMNYLP